MKCAVSSIYKTIEKEVEERTKRNFNIFAIGFHFENMHFNPVECKEVENIIAMYKSGLYDAEVCIKKIEERIKAA